MEPETQFIGCNRDGCTLREEPHNSLPMLFPFFPYFFTCLHFGVKNRKFKGNNEQNYFSSWNHSTTSTTLANSPLIRSPLHSAVPMSTPRLKSSVCFRHSEWSDHIIFMRFSPQDVVYCVPAVDGHCLPSIWCFFVCGVGYSFIPEDSSPPIL